MSKIESRHRARKAYVYVRQSTMAQVERNTESLERQYELAERAVALGWDASEVVIVDCDLGRSGKSATGVTAFGAWSPMSAWGRSGSCSGSRSRGSRGATPTGISCLTCAR
jgi:hypothetical protein